MTVDKKEEVEFENTYLLKKKNRYSTVTNRQIRDLFEERHKHWLYNDKAFFDRALSGCYWNEFIQTKWEEFYNGFRLGEELG